jgi:5-deoxy-glucuronate isomerase
MTTYFTSVGGEPGLNPASENPCRLIDFTRLVLRDGATHTGQTGEREVLLVLFGGRCSVTAGSATFESVGKRANPFMGKPRAVIV